jgi:hypothetical protein
MAIRIPQNKIVKSKYTVGKEYMFETTYREYQGYYYELNGKLFAGREFNSNAPILVQIKPDNLNKLLTNSKTYAYGRVSGVKINNTVFNTFQYINDPSAVGIIDRYFVQKTNNTPILIKEIDEETYTRIKNDSLYKTVTIRWNRAGFDSNREEIKKAEKQIFGITEYLRYEDESTNAGDAYEG